MFKDFINLDIFQSSGYEIKPKRKRTQSGREFIDSELLKYFKPRNNKKTNNVPQQGRTSGTYNYGNVDNKNDLVKRLLSINSGDKSDDVVSKPSPADRHKSNVDLAKYQEFGVNTNFIKENCIVNNPPYYQGDPYTVKQNGLIMTVTNKRTGKTATLNLEAMLKDYNLEDQASIIKQMQNYLPGEVLMDIANEITKFTPYDIYSKERAGVAAYYQPKDNSLHVDALNFTEVVVHELGHAISYTDRYNNYADKSEFKKVFENELMAYKASLGTPNNAKREDTYALTNTHEMFAECYAYLMTGKCRNNELLETHFKQTLDLVAKQLGEIKYLSRNVRLGSQEYNNRV